MTWNSLRLPAIALATGAMALFTLSHTTVLAQTASSTAEILPNTGQQLTPLAPVGARFTALNPGLSDYPTWIAGQAVTSITSPDYNTLLVLTSGYNRVNYPSGPNAGSRNQADSNEYVFVYDISHTIPVQKQVIQVANTYNGIAFDPGGQRFYVTGGVNDNVHIFTLQSGIWVEQPGSPVALGHSSGVGAGVSPAAAGVAVSQNGLVLVVTNYYNDSIPYLLFRVERGEKRPNSIFVRVSSIRRKRECPAASFRFG